jgi:hypothetical protein
MAFLGMRKWSTPVSCSGDVQEFVLTCRTGYKANVAIPHWWKCCRIRSVQFAGKGHPMCVVIQALLELISLVPF